MFETLIYPVLGFVGTLLGLEAAWHFTACKIPDTTLITKVWNREKLKRVLQKKNVEKGFGGGR